MLGGPGEGEEEEKRTHTELEGKGRAGHRKAWICEKTDREWPCPCVSNVGGSVCERTSRRKKRQSG